MDIQIRRGEPLDRAVAAYRANEPTNAILLFRNQIVDIKELTRLVNQYGAPSCCEAGCNRCLETRYKWSWIHYQNYVAASFNRERSGWQFVQSFNRRIIQEIATVGLWQASGLEQVKCRCRGKCGRCSGRGSRPRHSKVKRQFTSDLMRWVTEPDFALDFDQDAIGPNLRHLANALLVAGHLPTVRADTSIARAAVRKYLLQGLMNDV